MALLDTIRQFLAIEPWHEEARMAEPFVDVPDLATQLAALHAAARPWRAPSITEALGVPAIQRAVTLISNTTGSLTVQGWRNGVVMPEAPQLISRPDPYCTPRDFYRDAAYNMATRGEVILYIASRDNLGKAQALVVAPLAEVNVESNPRNRLFPIYTWGTTKGTRYSPANPTGDFVHVTYLKEPGALRGVGPLQLAGAATSVSVEAQEWAANFYASGGYPSIVLKSAIELDATEAAALKEQWSSTPSNMPKVTDPGIEEVQELKVNTQGAQMLDSREHQNGEAARMFGIPGSLMEYGSPGSSLTYQNLADVWVQFVRGCLAPNYLEPLEQALTDLLPRTTVARFAVAGLERADVKTRWEVYQMAAAVLGPEEAGAYAREREGLIPGDVEMAPVPFAPPNAVPASLPQMRTGGQVRCEGTRTIKGKPARCNALLAEAPPFTGRCWRCGMAHVEAVPVAPDDTRLRRLEDVVAAVASREPAPQPVHDDSALRDLAAAVSALAAREAPPPTIVNNLPEPAPAIDLAPLAEAIDALPARVAAAMPQPVEAVLETAQPSGITRIEYDDAGRISVIHEAAS